MSTTLLYVEDNHYSVYLMQFFLRRNKNYTLIVAPDGKSGWEQALLHKPDLILMDINLPDISGWDLSRRLKSHPITAHTPIIAVTSLTLKDSYDCSRQAGIDLHVSKTTRHTQLLQYVEELLNKEHSTIG